jgi:uncharacterized protein (TIGR02271 family)
MARQQQARQARTVVGIFPDRTSAERAIQRLIDAGFDRNRISLAMRREGAAEPSVERGGPADTKAEEGAATGAGVGAVIGGAAGVLAGLGAIAIPGIGPLVAAGPILAGLAGVAAGGAVGGLAGALIGMGIPEEEARAYEAEVHQGNVLVTVECDGQCDRARDILRDAGATNLGPRVAPTMAGTMPAAEAYPERRAETAPPRAHGAPEEFQERRVPVREEELTARKEWEEAGEVRVEKEVVREERHMRVPVVREEVEIERVRVDRPSDQGPREEEIRIPIHEEDVAVGKQPRVVEEIVIRKRPVTTEREVVGTVEREVPHVERRIAPEEERHRREERRFEGRP